MKKTLKEEGLRYVKFNRDDGTHILYNPETNRLEIWIANKGGHSEHSLIFRNTELEFCQVWNISKEKKKQILKQVKKRGKVEL